MLLLEAWKEGIIKRLTTLTVSCCQLAPTCAQRVKKCIAKTRVWDSAETLCLTTVCRDQQQNNTSQTFKSGLCYRGPSDEVHKGSVRSRSSAYSGSIILTLLTLHELSYVFILQHTFLRPYYSTSFPIHHAFFYYHHLHHLPRRYLHFCGTIELHSSLLRQT